ATPARSLPPIDAVFRFGSAAVHEWLRSIGWDPEWEYNDNFPDRDVVDAYIRTYMDQLPFYSGGTHAVLGGWHFPWPDGDWSELLNSQLLVWTFEGGEPWLECWASEGRLRAIERIT